jgi:hypothetical protein
MDGLCLKAFLECLGEAYADYDLLVVLDGAPSHTSIRADHTAGERELLEIAGLLSRVEPGGEVVFGVQARALQQDLRDGRATARGAHRDAGTLLAGLGPITEASGFLLVGGSHRVVETLMTLIGISVP